MLTVACVNHGNYLGFGDRYVSTLHAMVKRNLSREFQFVCLKDEGGPGWWSKIELFRPGRFSGRVVYIDLDSVIVGPLDELAESKGIIDLHDWGWKKHILGSGVMVWDSGEHAEVFTQYTQHVPERFRGDQDWITHLGGWPILPAHLCRSYRYDCVNEPPDGCVHVSMHGLPKPHEIRDGWVPSAWRM